MGVDATTLGDARYAMRGARMACVLCCVQCRVLCWVLCWVLPEYMLAQARGSSRAPTNLLVSFLIVIHSSI